MVDWGNKAFLKLKMKWQAIYDGSSQRGGGKLKLESYSGARNLEINCLVPKKMEVEMMCPRLEKLWTKLEKVCTYDYINFYKEWNFIKSKIPFIMGG